MEQAVEAAARLVQAGDVVLLSPGGTSFDAFRDFAERGNRFKDLVRDL
jgi:UDP-N-acetylmuramoylalanine--D-glutamate ligase